MNIKKIDEKDVPLLNRKRVNYEVEFTGATPKKVDIVKNISTNLKTKEELIAIRHIYQKYGMNKAKIIAHVYNKVEDLKASEPEKKIKEEAAKQPEAQKDKQEAPKPEVKDTKEEKPKEEKQETKVKVDGKEESKE